MRSALTMIELIFVIVVLGILSSVVIPKLASTRDDAKIAVISEEVQNALGEILASYSATGIIKKPNEMSQVLEQLVYTNQAVVTTNSVISGSVGQLTVYTQDGVGGYDHPFIFDINQTTLVFKYGSPCVGAICKALQKRVAEGNYTVGGEGIVF